MTWRRFKVLLKHLPADSATARAVGQSGHTTTDLLIMDVWSALTGKPHPARPKPSAQRPASSPEREARLADARRRAAARQAAIVAGQIA
ncbi:hypothetical protein [Microtetraspora niveoalba]|uniref:hypothetical protein n=1 Tax=Microtetraspora niveoalba TaxID=46175 RepID=UPI000A78CD76|nr:hypothetical protein [Microtetraspora niveoalba]